MKRTSLKASGDGSKMVDAYNAFYDENYSATRAFALSLLRDHEAARDVTQTSFLKLWENWSQADSINDKKAYLRIVIRNNCFDHLRSIKRREIYPGSLPESAHVELPSVGDIPFDVVIATIHKMLKELEPQCRKVLELSLKGLTDDQIAAQLETTKGNVQTQRSKGLARLRTKLSASDDYFNFLLLLFIHNMAPTVGG